MNPTPTTENTVLIENNVYDEEFVVESDNIETSDTEANEDTTTTEDNTEEVDISEDEEGSEVKSFSSAFENGLEINSECMKCFNMCIIVLVVMLILPILFVDVEYSNIMCCLSISLLILSYNNKTLFIHI